MSEESRKEREERAADALLVSALQEKEGEDVDPQRLPQLTQEERAAMDALGTDFVQRLRGERLSMVVECPNPACRTQSRLAPELIGRNARCRKCGWRFKVAATADCIPSADATTDHTPGEGSPLAGPPGSALPAHIGRFRVRSKLGQGSFGDVYRAYDPQLEREVALKVPRSGALDTPRRVERFLGDAKAAARLRHPHIVPVFEVGREDGAYFIASAFIDGKTLGAMLDQGKLDVQRSVQIVRALAEALAYAHDQGIVHRDVKPDNVMIDGRGQPHLIDFGLARRHGAADSTMDEEAGAPANAADAAAAHRTKDGAVMGTAAYMSPEAAAGRSSEARPTMDQYSLGATLYELLCGQTPFSGPLAIVLYNAINTDPPTPRSLNPQMPLDLEAICVKAMKKHPEDRYATCQHLADDLRRWQEGRPVAARRLRVRERLTRWCKRQPLLATALGTVAALLLLVAILGASFAGYYWYQSNLLKIANASVDAKRVEAENQTRIAAAKTRETLQHQAELLFDRGTALADQGEVGQAMIWLGESLQLAQEAGAAGLEHDIRMNLDGYVRRMHRLEAAVEDEAPVWAAAYRDDDSFFLAGGTDAAGYVQLYERGKPVGAPFKHDRAVRALAYDAARRWLLSGGESGKAILWDALSGRPLAAPLSPPIDDAQPAVRVTVTSVAISPDGKAVLAGCDDGNAYLWRLDDPTHPRVLAHGPQHAVHAAAFSPDGQMVLTGASGDQKKGEACLWDASTGARLALLPHDYPVNAVAFSPAADHLFATASGGSFHGDARLWQWDDKLHLVTPLGDPLPHQAEVYTACFSPDGAYLLTAGQDLAARLWDVASRKLVGQPMRHTRPVRVAIFRPDGRAVLTDGDDKVHRLWTTAPELAPRRSIVPPTPPLCVGTVFAAALADDDGVLLGGLIGSSIGIRGAAYLSDGQGATTPFATNYPVWAVACDGARNRFATGGGVENGPGEAQLWSRDGTEIGVYPHPRGVLSVAIRPAVAAPAAPMLATASEDGLVRLWDPVRNGRCLRTLDRDKNDPNKGRVYTVAFSPDGKALLAGYLDHHASLWDPDVDAEHPLLEWTNPGAVLSVAFGADGHTIVVGYVGGALLWDWDRSTNTIRQLGTAFPHQAGILGVAISTDGRRALTCGTDGVTELWDVETKRPLSPPWQRDGVTFSVAFAPDDGVLEAGTDGNLRGAAAIWNTPAGVDGDLQQVRDWTLRVASLKLEGGAIAPLSPAEWNALPPASDAAPVQSAPRPRAPSSFPTVALHVVMPPRGDVPPDPMKPRPEPLALHPASTHGPVWSRLLRYAPADTLAAAYIDMKQVRDSTLFKRYAPDKAVGPYLELLLQQPLLKAAGVDPLKDLDGVLLVGAGSLDDKGVMLCLVHGRFDPNKLRAAIDEAKKSIPGMALNYVLENGTPLVEIKAPGFVAPVYAVLLDAETVGLCSSSAVLADAFKGGGKDLQISSEMNKALAGPFTAETVWLAATIDKRLREQLSTNLLVGQLQPLIPKLESVTASIGLADGVDATLVLHMTDEKAAGDAQKVLMQFRQQLDLVAKGAGADPIYKSLSNNLKITVANSSAVVRVALSGAEIDQAVAPFGVKPAVPGQGPEATGMPMDGKLAFNPRKAPTDGEPWERLLRHAPGDTTTAAYIDVDRVLKAPLAAKYLTEDNAAVITGAFGEREALKAAGVNPLKDISNLLYVRGETSRASVLVLFHGRFDAQKMADALEAAQTDPRGVVGVRVFQGTDQPIVDITPALGDDLYLTLLDAETLALSSSRQALAACAQSGAHEALSADMSEVLKRVQKTDSCWLAMKVREDVRDAMNHSADPQMNRLAQKLEYATASLQVDGEGQAAVSLYSTDPRGVNEALGKGQPIVWLMAQENKAWGDVAGAMMDSAHIAVEKDVVKVSAPIRAALIEKALQPK